MNLPIEFTTTVKRKQLTAFYRKASFKRSLLLLLALVPIVILLAFLLFSPLIMSLAANTLYSIMLLLVPFVVLLVLWLLISYFSTSYFVNKLLKQDPSTTAVRAYALDLETVSHFSELSNGEFSWQLVDTAHYSDKLFSITMKNGTSHLIDPDDLDENQRKDMKALLVEKGLLA